MAGTNKFKIFNESKSSNTLSDDAYASNTQRANGLRIGDPANSNVFNKVLRQATMIAWAMAQIIADDGATVDDSDANTVKSQIRGYFDSVVDKRLTEEEANDIQFTSMIVVNGNPGGAKNAILFKNKNGVTVKQFNVEGKQDTLTEAQLAACDSGINANMLKGINDDLTTMGNTLISQGQSINNHTTALTNHGNAISTNSTNINTLQGYFTSGVAKKAKADADGNDIKTTYATKTELEQTNTNKQGKLTTEQLTALNNLVNGTIKINGWTLSIVS